MDPQLLEEGSRLADELAADPPAAVVLTGREGFFSAGVDLKIAPTLDADGQRGMVEGINAIFAGWYGFPRPVVAAVNGHAIAGGLILALCADYRVGSTEGKYGVTELKAGVAYPAVAMAVVRAELHAPAARRLVLGADLVGREGGARGGRLRRGGRARPGAPPRDRGGARPVAPAAGGLREGEAAAARPRARGGAGAARSAARGLGAARRPPTPSSNILRP